MEVNRAMVGLLIGGLIYVGTGIAETLTTSAREHKHKLREKRKAEQGLYEFCTLLKKEEMQGMSEKLRAVAPEVGQTLRAGNTRYKEM